MAWVLQERRVISTASASESFTVAGDTDMSYRIKYRHVGSGSEAPEIGIELNNTAPTWANMRGTGSSVTHDTANRLLDDLTGDTGGFECTILAGDQGVGNGTVWSMYYGCRAPATSCQVRIGVGRSAPGAEITTIELISDVANGIRPDSEIEFWKLEDEAAGNGAGTRGFWFG